MLKKTYNESGIRGTLAYLNINTCDVNILCLNNFGTSWVSDNSHMTSKSPRFFTMMMYNAKLLKGGVLGITITLIWH